MTKLVLALSALSLIAGAAAPTSAASPCRDKSGKFIKCAPKPAAKVKPKACRDAKGHFMKCK
jgi:hypothetical protein